MEVSSFNTCANEAFRRGSGRHDFNASRALLISLHTNTNNIRQPNTNQPEKTIHYETGEVWIGGAGAGSGVLGGDTLDDLRVEGNSARHV